MTKRKKVKPTKNSFLDLNTFLIFFGVFVCCFSIYIGYRIAISEKHLIPISVVFLLAGIIYEGRRLSSHWKTLILEVLAAFVFSLLAFLPRKGIHNYSFENNIEVWPYCFILAFTIISLSTSNDKVTLRISEGTTFLQSIAIIYWIIDLSLFNTPNTFLIVIVLIGLSLSLFSTFHAFTHIKLSRTTRLILSIWSTFIMALFAIDNIIETYQNQEIESASDFANGLYIGLEYFFLGVSSIYIIQNISMLTGFLPSRGKKDLSQLKKEHIKRYSMEQTPITHSMICLIFTGTIFYLNYQLQIVPRNTAIWLVFVCFPFVITLYNYTLKTITKHQVKA